MYEELYSVFNDEGECIFSTDDEYVHSLIKDGLDDEQQPKVNIKPNFEV